MHVVILVPTAAPWRRKFIACWTAPSCIDDQWPQHDPSNGSLHLDTPGTAPGPRSVQSVAAAHYAGFRFNASFPPIVETLTQPLRLLAMLSRSSPERLLINHHPTHPLTPRRPARDVRAPPGDVRARDKRTLLTRLDANARAPSRGTAPVPRRSCLASIARIAAEYHLFLDRPGPHGALDGLAVLVGW